MIIRHANMGSGGAGNAVSVLVVELIANRLMKLIE
jgi:hypothetical protein